MAEGTAPMAGEPGVEGAFRLGDVFAKSFSVFGRHPAAFIAIAAIILAPFYLMQLPAVIAPGRNPSGLTGVLLLLVMPFICPTIVNGAITYGVVQDLRGRPARMIETLGVLVRRLPPTIVIAVCIPLPVFAAYALAAVTIGAAVRVAPFIARSVAVLAPLAVLPSILIVYCVYAVAAPVCVAERAGILASLSRSRFLTKGHRWQIFGAFVLIFMADLIVSLIGAIFANQIGAGAQGLIMSYVVQAVFAAFNAVVTAVFYYQLRIARHGVDIANIADVFD
jgi:hypothetical protein